MGSFGISHSFFFRFVPCKKIVKSKIKMMLLLQINLLKNSLGKNFKAILSLFQILYFKCIVFQDLRNTRDFKKQNKRREGSFYFGGIWSWNFLSSTIEVCISNVFLHCL
jgi:hypothetical protein